MMGMRWLFATAEPWPLTNGTGLRVYHLARCLAAEGDEVRVLSDSREEGFFDAYERAGVSAVLAEGPEAARGSRWDPFDDHSALRDELNRQRGAYDVLVLAGPSALQYATSAGEEDAVIADVIDNPVLAVRRKLWNGANPLSWARRLRLIVELRRHIRRLGPRIDAACLVSEADAESFARLSGVANVFVSPNGVDLDYFAGGDSPDKPHDAGDVLFVGNMAFEPNHLAARMLLERVAPAVWQRRPGTRFAVVGPNPRPEVTRLAGPNAAVVGGVPDVRPYLHAAGAVCIPMTCGTGIKNKVLEAWASGRAVVGTPLAFQGLPARNGENAFVASAPRELAESIRRVLDDADLRARLGRAGGGAVADGFAWGQIARRFRDAAGSLLKRRTSGCL